MKRLLRRWLARWFPRGSAGAQETGAPPTTESGDLEGLRPGDLVGGAVEIPITGILDLHAFAPRDVASVVLEYLEAARARGLREVRIIHGKGIGVQREIVRSILSRHAGVLSYSDAPDASGWGATVVTLRDAPPP
jgi:DNA-nicking Smr family endonuclease